MFTGGLRVRESKLDICEYISSIRIPVSFCITSNGTEMPNLSGDPAWAKTTSELNIWPWKKTIKYEKNEKIEKFPDGPGCFGECRGVIPEYFYGIFEEFWEAENSKIKNWSKPVWNAFKIRLKPYLM